MMTQNSHQKFGLIVVSAPSGAGKSTLCARLLSSLSGRLSLSISTTTRNPRGTEKHGQEYFFVTHAEFEEKIKQNAFAEWAKVHDQYYGTSKQTLDQFWANKRHVLLDIDVQGSASLKKSYGSRCITIFVAPPNLSELEKRLRGRGTESEEAIQKRMKNAVQEMKAQVHFDRVILNDDLENAYAKLEKAVIEFMDQLESQHG